MSYAKARRHNRAARGEVEQLAEYNGGFFITREKRNRIAAATVAIVLLAFVKGLVLGHLFTRACQEEF